jgi:hypothetical protein
VHTIRCSSAASTLHILTLTVQFPMQLQIVLPWQRVCGEPKPQQMCQQVDSSSTQQQADGSRADAAACMLAMVVPCGAAVNAEAGAIDNAACGSAMLMVWHRYAWTVSRPCLLVCSACTLLASWPVWVFASYAAEYRLQVLLRQCH